MLDDEDTYSRSRVNRLKDDERNSNIHLLSRIESPLGNMIHRQLGIAILDSDAGRTLLRQRHVMLFRHRHPRPLALRRDQLVRGQFKRSRSFRPIGRSVLAPLRNELRLWSPFGSVDKLLELLTFHRIYQALSNRLGIQI